MVVGNLAAMVIGFAVFSAMGAAALSGNRSAAQNKLHSAMAMLLVLWSAAFMAQQLSGSSPELFRRLSAGLSLLFFSLLCHSCLVPLSAPLKKAALAAIYPSCLVLLAATALISEAGGAFARRLGFWVHGAPLASPLYLAQNGFCLAAGLVGTGAILARTLNSREIGERRPAIQRFLALGLSLSLYYANQWGLPLFGAAALYCPPLVFAPWALGILYSRSAHGYLSAETPEPPREGLPASLEYSLLVDKEGTLLEANEAAQVMLGISAEALKGKPLWPALSRPESVRTELRRIAAADSGQASCSIAWISRGGKPFKSRARITAVRDAFGRASGYLITPFALAETGSLKQAYSLTDREIEVMHFVAQGLPSQAIARELSITERTVKAHLTNIYDKMGIDSKLRLMSKLKDFDI